MKKLKPGSGVILLIALLVCYIIVAVIKSPHISADEAYFKAPNWRNAYGNKWDTFSVNWFDLYSVGNFMCGLTQDRYCEIWPNEDAYDGTAANSFRIKLATSSVHIGGYDGSSDIGPGFGADRDADYFYIDDDGNDLCRFATGADLFKCSGGGAVWTQIFNLTSAGAVNATSTITSVGGDIIATTGDIEATAGDVNAGDAISAVNDIVSSSGNIEATTGDVEAGSDVIAGLDLEVGDDARIAGQVNATDGFYIGIAGTYGIDGSGDINGSDIDGTDITASDELIGNSLAVNSAVISGDTESNSFTATNTIHEFSTDGTMADNSDDAVPTEAAVVTYVSAATTTIEATYLRLDATNGPVTGAIVFDSTIGATGTITTSTGDIVSSTGNASATAIVVNHEAVIDADHDLTVDNGTFDNDVDIAGHATAAYFYADDNSATSTFKGNVTIEGVLTGGSPVEVHGGMLLYGGLDVDEIHSTGTISTDGDLEADSIDAATQLIVNSAYNDPPNYAAVYAYATGDNSGIFAEIHSDISGASRAAIYGRTAAGRYGSAGMFDDSATSKAHTLVVDSEADGYKGLYVKKRTGVGEAVYIDSNVDKEALVVGHTGDYNAVWLYNGAGTAAGHYTTKITKAGDRGHALYVVIDDAAATPANPDDVINAYTDYTGRLFYGNKDAGPSGDLLRLDVTAAPMFAVHYDGSIGASGTVRSAYSGANMHDNPPCETWSYDVTNQSTGTITFTTAFNATPTVQVNFEDTDDPGVNIYYAAPYSVAPASTGWIISEAGTGTVHLTACETTDEGP